MEKRVLEVQTRDKLSGLTNAAGAEVANAAATKAEESAFFTWLRTSDS